MINTKTQQMTTFEAFNKWSEYVFNKHSSEDDLAEWMEHNWDDIEREPEIIAVEFEDDGRPYVVYG